MKSRRVFNVCAVTLFSLLFCLTLTASAWAASADGIKLGVYFEDGQGSDVPPTCCQPTDQLPTWENNAGRKADIFLWYESIFSGGMYADLRPIAEGGRTIELALEFPNEETPLTGSCSTGYPDNQLQHIIQGDYDECISWYAYDLWDHQQEFGGKVIIRPMSEMNGWWTDWGCGNPIDYPEYDPPPPGQCPNRADFVLAWRHLHDELNENLALNGVPQANWPKWLWTPNVDGQIAAAQFTFDNYYPGDGYVDYIGADGYNWGTYFEWSSWQTIDSVFDNSLGYYTTRTSKPVMISETASAEEGGDKAQWITDTFETLSQTQSPAWHGRVKSLTWFDEIADADLRVESNPENNWPAFKSAVDKAKLSWSQGTSYWASYADYQNRLVSIDYVFSNNTNFSHSFQIATFSASGGVTLASSTDLGSIAASPMPDQISSSAMTLKYHVPAGVSSFVLHLGIGLDGSASPSVTIDGQMAVSCGNCP